MRQDYYHNSSKDLSHTCSLHASGVIIILLQFLFLVGSIKANRESSRNDILQVPIPELERSIPLEPTDMLYRTSTEEQSMVVSMEAKEEIPTPKSPPGKPDVVAAGPGMLMTHLSGVIVVQLSNGSIIQINGSAEAGGNPPNLQAIGFMDGDGAGNHTTFVGHLYAKVVSGKGGHLMIWVSLLAVACFLLGVLVACVLAYLVYKKHLKKRLSGHYFNRHSDVETPKIESDAYSEHLPYNHTNETESPIADCHEEFLKQLPTHNHLNQIYINQMSELINQEGGIIKSDESDVIVQVLHGTLPRSRKRRVCVNVSLGYGDTIYTRTEFPKDVDVRLSPLVQLTSLGLQQFSKPVLVRIPHRANLWSWSEGSLSVIYCAANAGNNNNSLWRKAEPQPKEGTINKDVTFQFDQEYVYIYTYVPGTFVAVGRAGKTPHFRLCAVTYGSWHNNATPPYFQLTTYICDNHLDGQKNINQLESTQGSSLRISHYQSLAVYSIKDWAISLVNTQESARWQWTLPQGQHYVKKLSMQSVLNCQPEVPPCVTFKLVPKDLDHPPNSVQACLEIVQRLKNPHNQLGTSLITKEMLLKDLITTDDDPLDVNL